MKEFKPDSRSESMPRRKKAVLETLKDVAKWKEMTELRRRIKKLEAGKTG